MAAGRMNRQIAEQLFTSITVGVHVTRILAKLGVADPGEAAALAHHEVRTTIATSAHRTLRPNPLLRGANQAHEPETGHRPRHKGSLFSGRGGLRIMAMRRETGRRGGSR